MQLDRLSITGLFGRFDHQIDLRKSEKITIIHAPNGFGKTVILTLLNAFFSKQFGPFFKYQYKNILLAFDTGAEIEISKSSEGRTQAGKKSYGEGSTEIYFKLRSREEDNREQFKLSASTIGINFNRILPFIEPAGQELWLDENAGEIISSVEVISRYGAHLPPHMRKVQDIPKWLKAFTDSCECRLIETQRLLKLTLGEDGYRVRRPTGSGPTRAVVDEEARDLANRIGATLADYANRSQTLDQSFPKRVVAALYSPTAPASNVVSERLSGVDNNPSSLIDAGLIEATGAAQTFRGGTHT